MLKNKKKTTYVLQKLIPGESIGLEGGVYAAVPESGYKGHPFKIKHIEVTQTDSGPKYRLFEVEVKDWNKAVMFRKQPHTVPGRSGFFTLGYFKMGD